MRVMHRWDIYVLLKNVADGDPIDKSVIQEIEAMDGAEAIEGVIEWLIMKSREGR